MLIVLHHSTNHVGIQSSFWFSISTLSGILLLEPLFHILRLIIQAIAQLWSHYHYPIQHCSLSYPELVLKSTIFPRGPIGSGVSIPRTWYGMTQRAQTGHHKGAVYH